MKAKTQKAIVESLIFFVLLIYIASVVGSKIGLVSGSVNLFQAHLIFGLMVLVIMLPTDDRLLLEEPVLGKR